MKNVGFAPLYNPRVVQIVLENENAGQLFRFELDIDPRHWKPGKSYVLQERITLPGDVPGLEHVAACWIKWPSLAHRTEWVSVAERMAAGVVFLLYGAGFSSDTRAGWCFGGCRLRGWR